MSNQVEEKKDDIGSMCIILHRERSFHNIDIRILKSALQKYARRAMFFPKGIWCLIELDLFSYLEIKPDLYSTKQLTQKQIQLNSVRIRSNMINRLVAMMSEDVGPSNSQLPNKIYNLYLQWIKNRRDISSRKILIEIYYYLANENIQRIRLLSDLRTVFNLPEYLTDEKNLHRQLLEKFQMNEIINIMYNDENRKKTKEQLYENLIEHLSSKSEFAYAYLSLLYQRKDHTIIIQQLWSYLIRTSPYSDSTKALAYFYKTLKHKEHYLYLYHAMAFIIYQDKINKIDQQIQKFDLNVDQLYQDHLNEKDDHIELDSFVFDRHTGVATSRSDFALEGAQVVNESKELFIDKYRQMYNHFKIMIDNHEEEKKSKRNKRKIKDSNQNENITTKKNKLNTDDDLDEEIIRLGYQIDIKPKDFVSNELENLPHGQRRTGAHKKAVFISTDYVYKGPYLSNLPGDKKKFLNNLYFTCALLTIERHLNIPTHLRSIIDWESIIKIDKTNQYYLKQKSLGKLSNSLENDYELVTTKIETDVKVFKRGSHVNRLIELEKDQTNFQNDHEKQILQAALQHFYLRYLLNIGDSGTWNILVRRDDIKGICGIDFEEIRAEKTKNNNDPLTMIMSKVSKQQRDLYQPFLNHIIIFNNQIDINDDLAKTLSLSFKIHLENMNKRIEQFANCIRNKK